MRTELIAVTTRVPVEVADEYHRRAFARGISASACIGEALAAAVQMTVPRPRKMTSVPWAARPWEAMRMKKEGP